MKVKTLEKTGGTVIVACTCNSKYQDDKYGTQKRVHNFGKKAHNGSPGYRCSVCTKTKPA